MKNLLLLFNLFLFCQITFAQKEEKLVIKGKEDMKKYDLYGKYAADGYYFIISESEDHLFRLRYEMRMYNQEIDAKEIVESCEGFVVIENGKLILRWQPCVHKYEDVKTPVNKDIELKLVSKYHDGDWRTKKGNVIHLDFDGGPFPRRVSE
jgi:hypothetical protein